MRKHIESLPAVPSHYCRQYSTRLYLEEKLGNVSNLYRLYVEEAKTAGQNPVHKQTYRREFAKYNLAFHKPKKDKCSTCECFKNTPNKTAEDKDKQEKHQAEKEATYNQHKLDQENDEQDFICASFDLEKVLTTPNGDSMLLYYSRKYAVYNLTVYESKTRRGFCNLWGESDAGRGAIEVGTCIYRWLEMLCHAPAGSETQHAEKTSATPKHVVMYCDCCGGQNRNRFIVAMLIYANRNLDIQELELKFLLSGHTYMQVNNVSWFHCHEHNLTSSSVAVPLLHFCFPLL